MSEKEHSVDFLMIKLLHVYATKIFHQLSHVNLHPGQMPMLDILYRQEGLSQREICSRLCIKPSTVTVSLQRMEKAALIYRVADAKDKRIQRIYLTDSGKEIHREVEKIRKEEFSKQRKIIRMIRDQIFAGCREQALPVGTCTLCQLLFTGRLSKICRGTTHIMNVSFKIRIFRHLNSFF